MPALCIAKSANVPRLLFAPGDSPRKMDKAGASAADLVIIDNNNVSKLESG